MARGKLYELTEEHHSQLGPWKDRWVANAMSTAPMNDADREICRGAVRRMYQAAGLTPPPDERIVFVASPFIMRFAAGFAAWIWHCSENPEAAQRARGSSATGAATWAATRAATGDAAWAATRAATRDATRAATWDATRDATRDATGAATGDATWAATRAATGDAAWAATGAATGDAAWADLDRWYVFPDMRELADAIGVGSHGLMCAYNADNFWQGGNQWSAEDAFISFFRHVAQMPLDYSKWEAWELLSLHSGPRIVHSKFCIISDRPEILQVDDQNRPHSDSGPFCRWRDGAALYSVHGVRLPAWIIERADTVTVEKIDAEANAEIRRIMMERYGWPRFLKDAGAAILNHDDRWGTLYRRDIPNDEPLVMVEVINRSPEPDGSFRHYTLRVSPECCPLFMDGRKGRPQKLTALNAVASTFGMTGAQYAQQLAAES
jgi:Domain of unknown function (DUF6745)